MAPKASARHPKRATMATNSELIRSNSLPRTLELRVAAKRTKTTDQVKEVAATLAATRKTLARLAEGERVSIAKAKAAFDALEAIRSSIAAHRSSSTERILRGRLRS